MWLSQRLVGLGSHRKRSHTGQYRKVSMVTLTSKVPKATVVDAHCSKKKLFQYMQDRCIHRSPCLLNTHVTAFIGNLVNEAILIRWVCLATRYTIRNNGINIPEAWMPTIKHYSGCSKDDLSRNCSSFIRNSGNQNHLSPASTWCTYNSTLAVINDYCKLLFTSMEWNILVR